MKPTIEIETELYGLDSQVEEIKIDIFSKYKEIKYKEPAVTYLISYELSSLHIKEGWVCETITFYKIDEHREFELIAKESKWINHNPKEQF